MAHEFVFTSLDRTLAGGSGYGIVAQSPQSPKFLCEEVSKLAGYREIYPLGDPNWKLNPVNHFFWKNGNWFILGRIGPAENDYSGRSNYLGHFLVLDHSEIQEAGPIRLLLAYPFLNAFEGQARILAPPQLPRLPESGPKVCDRWGKATGDPGWGGVIAENLRDDQPTQLLYPKSFQGNRILELIGESFDLLSPAERWAFTFSTHIEGFPRGNQVKLRALQQGGPASRDFKKEMGCLDLGNNPWPSAPHGRWTDLARNGKPSKPNSEPNFSQDSQSNVEPALSQERVMKGIVLSTEEPGPTGVFRLAEEGESLPVKKFGGKIRLGYDSPGTRAIPKSRSQSKEIHVPWWLYLLVCLLLIIVGVTGVLGGILATYVLMNNQMKDKEKEFANSKEELGRLLENETKNNVETQKKLNDEWESKLAKIHLEKEKFKKEFEEKIKKEQNKLGITMPPNEKPIPPKAPPPGPMLNNNANNIQPLINKDVKKLSNDFDELIAKINICEELKKLFKGESQYKEYLEKLQEKIAGFKICDIISIYSFYKNMNNNLENINYIKKYCNPNGANGVILKFLLSKLNKIDLSEKDFKEFVENCVDQHDRGYLYIDSSGTLKIDVIFGLAEQKNFLKLSTELLVKSEKDQEKKIKFNKFIKALDRLPQINVKNEGSSGKVDETPVK